MIESTSDGRTISNINLQETRVRLFEFDRAIVSYFHMHLRSIHDCMRGRRMNRNVRLSYAVIFHTLTSNIANFDLPTRAARIRCFSSGLMNTPGISCHAVRFSIYEAFNPIFSRMTRRWCTWDHTEGEDCRHTLALAYYEHHIPTFFTGEREIGLFRRRLNAVDLSTRCLTRYPFTEA